MGGLVGPPDGNGRKHKIVNKVDRSSKSASSFCNIRFFLPSSIIDASFEVPASPVASVVAEKLARKGLNMTGAKMKKKRQIFKNSPHSHLI